MKRTIPPPHACPPSIQAWPEDPSHFSLALQFALIHVTTILGTSAAFDQRRARTPVPPVRWRIRSA
eukprot:5144683-Pyramimonas_sp.AAC.1